MPTASTTVAVDWLLCAVAHVFVGAGLSQADADTVAIGLVEADLRGIPSHGVMLVPMYVDRLAAGSVTTASRGEVVVDAGAVAVVDAGHAMGILTADQGMALAIERARMHGVGVVVARHAFHFGAAFRYVAAAARAGMVGIAAANTRPLMPAPGGARAVVGNNPLAIGVPRSAQDPIILDMALSEAALGKIRLAAAEGRAIPATWATDAAGQATTDPQAAIAGMLLPAAGPKGFGLAFMLDVLTGVLSGGAFGSAVKGLYGDPAVPNDCAHLFIAVDPGAFGDRRAFTDGVLELAGQVTASPAAPGVDRVRLPGEPEADRRAAARTRGADLDASVLAALHDSAATLGVDLPEREGAEEAEGAEG
jgi:LDH2 family malate/lactate/ureidoglycolate dehydrogenase